MVGSDCPSSTGPGWMIHMMTCADYYTKATLLMKFRKSSVFSLFFFYSHWRKNKLAFLFWDRTTHTMRLRHTQQTALMDMESVSQRAYIHGSASSSVMLQASNGGWNFLRILPSSHRKQQTNLVRTCWARSVMQQIAAHPYYSQTEQERVNQNSQHS